MPFVNGLMKVLVATTAVVVLGSVTAVLVVPPSEKERLVQLEAEAQQLVDRVAAGVRRYRRECGVFPPGNGTGSSALVRALSEPSRTGDAYVRFRPEELTGMGHLRNPFAPEIEIVYYRNNRVLSDPPYAGRNLGAFDLWCRDAQGFSDGVNNWEGGVSSP